MLPGLNGYQVCATLRASGNWTPILMLTAKDGEFDEAEALDTGADDFLTKPFSFVVLVARLRALLRRGSGARPDRAHGRRPAPRSRRAPGAGAATSEIALTPREFAVLEYLMRRAGEVRVEARDPRARVGLRLRGRPEHRRGLHRPPPAARSTSRSVGKRSRRSGGVGYRLDPEGG